MTIRNPARLVLNLAAKGKETEWIEFKASKFNPETVGRYISALANSAIFCGESKGYLIFGIEDGTHNIIGTDIRIERETVGNDTFLFWLSKKLDPRVNVEHASVVVDGKAVEILAVGPTYHRPVKFNNVAYIRIDTSLQELSKHPERERAIWQITSRFSFEQGIAQSHVNACDGRTSH